MKIREMIKTLRANYPLRFSIITSVIVVLLVTTYYKLVMSVFSVEMIKAVSFLVFTLLLLAIQIIFLKWLGNSNNDEKTPNEEARY